MHGNQVMSFFGIKKVDEQIEEQLHKQDELMKQIDDMSPNKDDCDIHDWMKKREAMLLSGNVVGKSVMGSISKARTLPTHILHLAKVAGVDPEWLWMEDSIFSSEDKSKALMNVNQSAHIDHTKWWNSIEILVGPAPEPDDRVNNYLKNSQEVSD